jgi:hypothetical protein
LTKRESDSWRGYGLERDSRQRIALTLSFPGISVRRKKGILPVVAAAVTSGLLTWRKNPCNVRCLVPRRDPGPERAPERSVPTSRDGSRCIPPALTLKGLHPLRPALSGCDPFRVSAPLGAPVRGRCPRLCYVSASRMGYPGVRNEDATITAHPSRQKQRIRTAKRPMSGALNLKHKLAGTADSKSLILSDSGSCPARVMWPGTWK